jgi:hypothetical protein
VDKSRPGSTSFFFDGAEMKLRTPPRRAYEHAICDQPSRTRRQFSLNHPAHPFEHVHRFDPTPRLRTNAQPVLSATIMVPMTLRSRLRLFEFSDLLTTTRLYRRTIYSTPAAQRRLPISGRRYFFFCTPLSLGVNQLVMVYLRSPF